MRQGGVLWAMLSFGWAVACGGRYEKNAPTSDGVERAGSSASTSGSAGMSSYVGGGGAVAVAGTGATDATCADQFIAYNDYRSQVIAEFSSFKCATDGDCRSVYHQSPCDPSCVLLTSAAHRGVIDRLNNFGIANCSSDCWPQAWQMCPTAAPVHCSSGQCQ